MKKILTLVLVLIAFAFSAQAQTALITATITITNDLVGATNGSAITVNGVQRIFTNIVTSSQTQIMRGTNIIGVRTNLFYAYVIVRPPGLTVAQYSSNVVQFQTMPGFPLTISISPHWATLTTATTYNTNMTQFRGYAKWVGAYERTNTANGIVSYLSDDSVTNPVPFPSRALQKYAGTNDLASTSNALVALAYKIGLGNTNLSYLIGQAGTNLITLTSNALGGLIYQVGNDSTNLSYMLADANTNFTLITSNNLITELIALGLSYRLGNDIHLTTTDTTLRLEAIQGGIWEAYFDDGISFPFLEADTSDNVFLYDHAGTKRYQQNDAAVNNGETIIRSASGNDSLLVARSDAIIARKVLIFNADGGGTWTAASVGTVTNFISSAGNSGTGATTVHQFNVPANTMTNDEDSFTRTIGVTYSASSATKRTEVYFAGTQIYDTGAIANTGTGGASITCEITRINSSTISYRCQGITTGTASTSSCKVGTIGGLDFTTAINCYVILTSGVGGASNDFQVIQDNVKLAPSPLWSAFP